MGEISWPTKPFYIMSKIGLSNWVLTEISIAAGFDALTMQARTGTIDQLWMATPDPRGGAILRHIKSDLVISCLPLQSWIVTNKPSLNLQPFNSADPLQLFRLEDVGDNWVAINGLFDWEYKINVFGSDPHGRIGMWPWDGGDNEQWKLLEEAGDVTVNSIEYDLSQAKGDLGQPPTACKAEDSDNTQGSTEPLTGTITLKRVITTTTQHTISESDTTSHKYSQTFGIKGGIAKVVEVTTSLSFEEADSKTTSSIDQKTHSTTDTDTLSTNTNVPPGKKYRYQVVVHYGKVSVPFTAHLTFQSSIPGIAPLQFTSKGVFNGVNYTGYEIVCKDITSPDPKQHTEVSRTPIQS